jgi:hypothetical protein
MTKHDLAIAKFVDNTHFLKLARTEALEHEDGYLYVTRANCIVRVKKAGTTGEYKKREGQSMASTIIDEAVSACRFTRGAIIPLQVLDALVPAIREQEDTPLPPHLVFSLPWDTADVDRVKRCELVKTIGEITGFALRIHERNYRVDGIENIVAAARIMEINEIEFREWPEQYRALFLFAGIEVLLASDTECIERVITRIIID